MHIESVQPTGNVSLGAKLASDPQTLEIVKRMACVAPMTLAAALVQLERSPLEDTIAIKCENHYDVKLQRPYEFYTAQNVFTKAEVPLHSGKNIKNTCIDAVETFLKYVSKPHKVLFSNATDFYKRPSTVDKAVISKNKTPYEVAEKKFSDFISKELEYLNS